MVLLTPYEASWFSELLSSLSAAKGLLLQLSPYRDIPVSGVFWCDVRLNETCQWPPHPPHLLHKEGFALSSDLLFAPGKDSDISHTFSSHWSSQVSHSSQKAAFHTPREQLHFVVSNPQAQLLLWSDPALSWWRWWIFSFSLVAAFSSFSSFHGKRIKWKIGFLRVRWNHNSKFTSGLLSWNLPMFMALGEKVLVGCPARNPPERLWLLGRTAQPNHFKAKW